MILLEEKGGEIKRKKDISNDGKMNGQQLHFENGAAFDENEMKRKLL